MMNSRSRLVSLVLVVSMVMAYVGCMPESEIISDDQNLPLLVTRDTLIFDTLFSSVGSFTRRVKVINPNENAIVFDRIGLGRGEGSPYRVIINGEPQATVTDEFLRGGDSILVLVEVTIDPQDQDLPFLERDSLVMEWNGNQAHIKLLAWGQDANFLGNQRIACNTRWTADRPYVIYDRVLVDSGCTLTIEAGTQVYFNVAVPLLVAGSLVVEGDSGNMVTFQQSRLDEDFIDAPGQWLGIQFGQNSTGNVLEYAHIKNAVNGIFFGNPDQDSIIDLTIGHSIIETMSSNGLIAFTSDVYVYNTQVNNCFQFAVANLAGGHYRYDHVTVANFNNIQRSVPAAVFADNVILADNSLLVAPLDVKIRNSIFWGSEDEEILLDNGGRAVFDVEAYHSIIKSLAEEFPGTEVLYVDPVFADELDYDLRIDSLSPAVNRGMMLNIEDDIRGRLRKFEPDLGAYERQ